MRRKEVKRVRIVTVVKSKSEKIRLELVQRSKTMDVASKPATANDGQLTQL